MATKEVPKITAEEAQRIREGKVLVEKAEKALAAEKSSPTVPPLMEKKPGEKKK